MPSHHWPTQSASQNSFRLNRRSQFVSHHPAPMALSGRVTSSPNSAGSCPGRDVPIHLQLRRKALPDHWVSTRSNSKPIFTLHAVSWHWHGSMHNTSLKSEVCWQGELWFSSKASFLAFCIQASKRSNMLIFAHNMMRKPKYSSFRKW